MKVDIITDGAVLTTAIKTIALRGAELDLAIHQAAVSAAQAVADHGNIGYCNSLYRALGKGARHVAMAQWLITYAGVSANTKKDKDVNPFVFDKSKAVDVGGGMDHPWFDLKPSQEPDAVLDVAKLVQALVKKAKSPKEGVEVLNSRMIAGLESLLAEVVRDDTE